MGDRHAGQGHQERRRVATRTVASRMADQAPMVLGPPLLLVSSCFPQPRHSRYQLPWGLRRRCQRWSPTLHRQGLAIAASLGIGHTGSPSQTLGSYQPAVQVGAQSLDWTCRSKRRRGPGRRGTRTSSQLVQRCDGAGRGRSMLAFRSVVSVLLRELGDVSLHPQGRPCGRPPKAAVLAPATTRQRPGNRPHPAVTVRSDPSTSSLGL